MVSSSDTLLVVCTLTFGDNPLETGKGLVDHVYDEGLVGAGAPRLPSFILVVSSSDTLLVVSTLHIV